MKTSFESKPPLYSKPQSSATTQQTPAQPSYQAPYPQATPTNTPYPTGPTAMPQPYATPQPNNPLPYPTSTGYQAPYQPYTGMPAPLSLPTNLDQTGSSPNNSSTHSLNQTGSGYSGYGTIQPSHIRASLISAIDEHLRQRLKELMGKVYI
jgi:ESCRT-I complex subunit TSG101